MSVHILQPCENFEEFLMLLHSKTVNPKCCTNDVMLMEFISKGTRLIGVIIQ